ncbi:uncharacterized protein [Cardiocondyla obscurior]|uniref:uncharacterized protein n=1 Tax=Cardiocondyla obscurior TaxID=286306 RepID=UPI0039656F4B
MFLNQEININGYSFFLTIKYTFALAEMVSIISRYFKFNRYIMLAIGIWPYQNSKFSQVQVITIFSIILSYIIFQLTTLLMKDCTTDFVIKVISSACVLSSILIPYNAFWFNADNMRSLINSFQQSYDQLKNLDEIAIIDKYSNKAKFFTTIFTTLTGCGIFVICMLPMLPRIVGVFLPINSSQSYQIIPIETEYFINQDNYFYLILLHANASICMAGMTMVALCAITIMIMKYTCGMLSIARYN